MSTIYNDPYTRQAIDIRKWINDNVMTTPEAIE